MKRRIKESKSIFPCTVYMENQDYDEVYYYLDTPEYGLSWRYFDDVEQEDIENYKYIIKNIADLRKAIDDLEEDFIHGYGNSYFKLSENYMEDLLNRGKTLVRVKKEHKERVYIIRVKPAQNVELALAESFEKTIKNLQREGLFENVSSFDLNFNGKGINIKLNENTNMMPSVEELDELKTKFYNLVGACEDYDYEYRSKYSNIYLVYLDNQSEGTGGTAEIDFPMYSLDKPEEALNGDGRLVGVMCEYLAEEADPKDLFKSKLKINNFIKKFCNKYHLTPMFYIGSRDKGDKNWEKKGADICCDIWETVYDPDIDGYYDFCEISGPFGVEYDSSSDY